VLTLNIGGIANCQLADRDRAQMMAFDTGPGNVMLDHAARVLFDKPYDADGAIAASGHANNRLLEVLLNHPFFFIDHHLEALGASILGQASRKRFWRQIEQLGQKISWQLSPSLQRPQLAGRSRSMYRA
jgi:1,6-anhydro-N-acetylmuramate kinase